MSHYRIHRCGDTGLAIEFGDKIDRDINSTVVDLSRRLRLKSLSGIDEIVPTFRSLFVSFDPLLLSEKTLLTTIDALLSEPPSLKTVARSYLKVPVCYDSAVAEDIDSFAHAIGMTKQDVIGLHCSCMYSVYMLGFLPGQPYLGDLPEAMRTARRLTPRTRIPAGSVAVATSLTCIFPMETPCGWHLIGRTPVRLWREGGDPQPVFKPGDMVLFEPISLDEFERISNNPDCRPAVHAFEAEIAA